MLTDMYDREIKVGDKVKISSTFGSWGGSHRKFIGEIGTITEIYREDGSAVLGACRIGGKGGCNLDGETLKGCHWYSGDLILIRTNIVPDDLFEM